MTKYILSILLVVMCVKYMTAQKNVRFAPVITLGIPEKNTFPQFDPNQNSFRYIIGVGYYGVLRLSDWGSLKTGPQLALKFMQLSTTNAYWYEATDPVTFMLHNNVSIFKLNRLWLEVPCYYSYQVNNSISLEAGILASIFLAAKGHMNVSFPDGWKAPIKLKHFDEPYEANKAGLFFHFGCAFSAHKLQITPFLDINLVRMYSFLHQNERKAIQLGVSFAYF